MKSSLKIVATYACVATAWIVLSDNVVSVIAPDTQHLTSYSIVKGIFFILVTSTLLFLLVRKELRARQSVIDHLARVLTTKDELIRELHHRVKNSLQSTISIVELESATTGFTEDAKNRIVNKLLSLSAVYDLVYNSIDFENLSFSAMLHNLIATRLAGIKTELSISKDFQCAVEDMISIVLGINELIEAMRTENTLDSLAFHTGDACGITILARFNGAIPDPGDLDTPRLFLRAASRTLRIEREPGTIRLILDGSSCREDAAAPRGN